MTKTPKKGAAPQKGDFLGLVLVLESLWQETKKDIVDRQASRTEAGWRAKSQQKCSCAIL